MISDDSFATIGAIELSWLNRKRGQFESWAASIAANMGLLASIDPAVFDARKYARKVHRNGHLLVAHIGSENVGCLVLYCNDDVTEQAFIPFLAVQEGFRRKGVATAMLRLAISRARRFGMRSLALTVDSSNGAAQQCYARLGFRATNDDGRRRFMQLLFGSMPTLPSGIPTAIEPHPHLAADFDLAIDLWIKRDDLYPSPGGGIKARKAAGILKDAIYSEQDVIVTNGSPLSNHARSIALGCGQLGIDCHVITVIEKNQRPEAFANHQIVQLSGATVEYCTKEMLSEAMDEAINRYSQMGRRPKYVWGGGHVLSGNAVMRDAGIELKNQLDGWMPDYAVVASATGGTHAGLAVAFADWDTQVLGISVARSYDQGSTIVAQAMHDLGLESPTEVRRNLHYFDRWRFGGYGAVDDRLLAVVRHAARHGVLLDPTYSGKAFAGMVDLVRERVIEPGSSVVFWHTGGLLNLSAYPKLLTTQP